MAHCIRQPDAGDADACRELKDVKSTVLALYGSAGVAGSCSGAFVVPFRPGDRAALCNKLFAGSFFYFRKTLVFKN